MQNIYIAIGDPVTAEAIQNILDSIAAPSILNGFNLSAPAADQIAVSPGSALTDSGVIISETEISTIQFTQIVQPANYTILYQYVPSTNFGGNPAVLTLQPGLIQPSTFSNGVLLGWLQYPGASVPLTNSMFVSAKRIRLDAPAAQQAGVFTTEYAPFSHFITLSAASGPFPTVTESYNGGVFAPQTTIQNTGLGLSHSTYLFPFQISPYGLGKIAINMSVSSQASCTLNLVKSDGTVIPPIGNNFFTNQPLGTIVLSFAQGNNFVPGDVCYVQFVSAIQPSNTVVIQSIGTSAYTEPF